MDRKLDRGENASCCQDYVIKDGGFVGRFDEMYRNIPDPWGCVEKVNILKNRLLLSLLREYRSQDRVLDVGCGLGILSGFIKQETGAKEMFACDVSEVAIEQAKQAVPDVEFFVHDLVGHPELPFPDGTFSMIVMAEVVWYVLPVLEQLCSELCRVLCPSGRLVIKQSFLPPGKQKYGNEIVSNPEDLRGFVVAVNMAIEREIMLSEADGERVYILSAH